VSGGVPREPRPDEDLVELLLGGGPRSAERDGSLSDEERARLEGWRGFLAGCRAELDDGSEVEGVDLGALRERVLARTTREDVSLRGDLLLWRGFLAQRLRSSAVLRVVAASLLVHVAALPVLAYYTWRAPAPERGVRVDFARPSEPPFRESEPEPPSEVDAPEVALPPVEAGRAERTARELYRERLLAAGMADLDGFSERPGPRTVVWDDPLTLALRCEQLLDERAAGRVDAPRLDFTLDALEEELVRLALRDELPRLRAVLASAHLRAIEAGLRPARGALADSARRWVGPEGRLAGAPWRAAVQGAALELEGR
jgi:hypothetical protein